jgi:hypothetical protein
MSNFGSVRIRNEDGGTVSVTPRGGLETGSQSTEEILSEVLTELKMIRVMMQEKLNMGDLRREDV